MLGWISICHIWFKPKWQPLKYNDNVFSKVLCPRKQLEDRNHGLKHLHLVWKVHHCPYKWSFLTSSPNNKQKQCTYKTSNKHSLQSFSYVIPSNSSTFFESTRMCHMTCVKSHWAKCTEPSCKVLRLACFQVLYLDTVRKLCASFTKWIYFLWACPKKLFHNWTGWWKKVHLTILGIFCIEGFLQKGCKGVWGFFHFFAGSSNFFF